MNKEFNGKVALVTGGTSGIGEATALAFANLGAEVAITGRRKDLGKKVLARLHAKGVDSRFICGDISKEKDCYQMVESVLEAFGRLDFAFNNAAIEGKVVPVTEQTDQNFHNVVNTNVLGVMNSMKYEIPAMLKNGGGSIVNSSSISGTVGMPGMSVYCASKHAVIGLTKAVAVEFGSQGIRVNAVSPGAVKTEMYDRFTKGSPEARDFYESLHPIGRVGECEEIANPVAFLCSEGASFITGANIPIDGAFTTV
ncbi:MAG: short chain dehydrogenase [Methylococcaceae bacterium TMED69]|nr:MAG: short chain dehydrogenase [Methylococcaceae bacterium TMED69]|tara:strand:+ start:117 stop:878 length:762 start_codon:yes stop_codon:yes gene_type:complete